MSWIGNWYHRSVTNSQIAHRGRPRTKPEAERREDFLDAAQDLFLGEGYEATSVERITRAAGVAKGTFYLYFRSKEELLLALRNRFMERGSARFEELLLATQDRPFEEQLDALIEFAFTFYRENWPIFNLVFRRFAGKITMERAETRRRYAEPLAALITRAIERGEAGTGGHNPKLFAYLILGAIEENIHSCLSSGDPPDADALKQASKAFVRRALAP